MTAQSSSIGSDQHRGPLSGARWDRYRLAELLGEGGMASVYLARDLHHDRMVALKVLPGHLAEKELLRHRFAMEVRTANGIDSPHVVPVYDAGDYRGMLYYSMELMEGGSLSPICADTRRGKPPPSLQRALGWIRQTAMGLKAAAERGIVHRDIKPGNLMLTRQGLLKIADFGIAHMVWSTNTTGPGSLGTPAYMSPEQASDGQIDSRSDLYSLGCVFYELLTGRQPFKAGSTDALVYQHHFAEPKTLVQLRPDLPPTVQSVIFTLMQKDPTQRYQTATELLDDLEALAGDRAPHHAPTGRSNCGGAGARARRRPNRDNAWLLAGAAVMMVASLGILFWHCQRALTPLDGMRARLSVLDSPAPLPVEPEPRLRELAVLVGMLADYAERVEEDDPDLVRWRQRVAALATTPGR